MALPPCAVALQRPYPGPGGWMPLARVVQAPAAPTEAGRVEAGPGPAGRHLLSRLSPCSPQPAAEGPGPRRAHEGGRGSGPPRPRPMRPPGPRSTKQYGHSPAPETPKLLREPRPRLPRAGLCSHLLPRLWGARAHPSHITLDQPGPRGGRRPCRRLGFTLRAAQEAAGGSSADTFAPARYLGHTGMRLAPGADGTCRLLDMESTTDPLPPSPRTPRHGSRAHTSPPPSALCGHTPAPSAGPWLPGGSAGCM